MDGHVLEVEDDRFDIVASEFGVMLFPDLPRGLREMVRVTKPGGRTVVVALGSPMKIEFFQFFIRDRDDTAGDGRPQRRARRGEWHGCVDQSDPYRHRHEVTPRVVSRTVCAHRAATRRHVAIERDGVAGDSGRPADI